MSAAFPLYGEHNQVRPDDEKIFSAGDAASRSASSPSTHAERPVHEREGLLNAILKTTLDGFLMMSSVAAYAERGLRLQDVDPEFRWHTVASQRMSTQAGESGFESVYRRKDGTAFPVSVHLYHLQFMGEETDVAQVEDITERKRADARLRIMAEMLDCAPSSITVHDQDGRFLYANEKNMKKACIGEVTYALDVLVTAFVLRGGDCCIERLSIDRSGLRHWF